MPPLKTVKGFRDFPPEACARRNDLFALWRDVALRYGFREWEGPTVEATDLYRKKSGDEITSQLFCFPDKKGRELSLRPELTPSLARIANASQRDYRKPLKWFEIGACFRYEEPQKGRTREFYQFNCDILGEPSPAADAELIALAVDLMRDLGFTAQDFTVRLSDRRAWSTFAEGAGLAPEQIPTFLSIIDRLEKLPEEEIQRRLASLSLTLDQVRAFMAQDAAQLPSFQALHADLSARGLWDFITPDLSIVRGLAYYTGAVFEVFDLKHNLRAIAGGGRYDQLCHLLSDGQCDLPAAGFAMGDVVVSLLVEQSDHARALRDQRIAASSQIDAYLVVADEAARPHALAHLQQLRTAGLRVDLALSPTKPGKQFQAAEAAGATYAVVFGAEYPQLQLKHLASRDQLQIAAPDLPAHLTSTTPFPTNRLTD